MSTITVAAENSSRFLSRELLEREARLEDYARIARAIAQRMDPEWREFVEQEQQLEREIAWLSPSEAQPLP
jgi:hypothetical protein